MRTIASRIGLSVILAILMIAGLPMSGTTTAGAEESDGECLDCDICPACGEHPIMYPSRETIDRWIEEYYSLPVAEIPEMPLTWSKTMCTKGSRFNSSTPTTAVAAVMTTLVVAAT